MTTFGKTFNRQPILKNADSIPAEFSLIGTILRDPRLIKYCLDMNSDYFYDIFCAKAFECAVDLHMRSQEISFSSMHDQMSKNIHLTDEDLFNSLYDCFENAHEFSNDVHAKIYSKLVTDKYVEREVSAAAKPIDDIARNDGVSSEQKIASARKILDEAEKKLAGPSQLISADEMIEMTLHQSEETRVTGTIPGIPSGFSDLDAMTSGFAPSELIILAARPSMGKTALALCIAHNAAAVENKSVLLISLEMDAKQLGTRWISLIAGVDMYPISNGKLTGVHHQKINNARRESKDVPFFIDETPSMTLSQSCNRARKLHAQTDGGLGILIIDYIGLITDSGRSGASKSELIGEISRGLKQLSRELKIPVVALSQLNRDLEKRQDKRPQMSDLRDSGAIEQDADVILFLYRDEVYNKQSIDAGLAEIIVAKQRKGRTGTVIVNFNGAQSRFYDRDSSSSTTQIIKTFKEKVCV